MPVKTEEDQLDQDAPARGYSQPPRGAPPGQPGHEGDLDLTGGHGWRRMAVTLGVWALALLSVGGRALRGLALIVGAGLRAAARALRRRWPGVGAELKATPGELASIAAVVAVDALSDLAGLVRGAREALAWAAWSAWWLTRRAAHGARANWPGLRRRFVAGTAIAAASLIAATVAMARAAARVVGLTLWLSFRSLRALVQLLARGVPALLSGTAALARGVRSRRGEARARFEKTWAQEQRRPQSVAEPPIAEPRPLIGPGRMVARLGMVALATSATLLVLVAGGTVATRTAVGAVNASMHVRSGHVALPPLHERSIVYAADGSILAVLHADDNRQPVTLSQVAPPLVDAVVDTEDAHFWKHGGVDPLALVRALVTDLAAGRARQGGSTIAQQLVKNTLLTPKRSLVRKIKEVVLADRVEHQLGKRAVLERYLNTVYFGEGAYGVEAAAETFFAVPASRLDAGQSALLAGLIQDPDGYDPLHDPAATRQRRQTVLGLMVAHHHLAPETAQAMGQEPVPASVHRPPEGRDYFSDAVKQELLADPRLGATSRDRYLAVFTGGLRVHTTLDPVMQKQAQAAIAGGLPPSGMRLTAALVAVDPGTGAVRALVGGPDYGQSQFDAALAGAGRQPGSSFKSFTMAAALAQGYSPADVLDGSTPCSIPNPGGTPDPWVPGNFEGEAFGPITLTDATVHSVNCAYARLAPTVGLRRIAELAHAMGITSHLSLVPSMTLGTNDVTPLQMASAYATLAADGIARPAHLVEEVDSADGKPLLRAGRGERRVLSSQVVREETQMLSQVVQSGTGQAAAVAGRSVAGKTGTAENYQDAWFVGYSPDLATAVWMGDPDGEVPMRGVEGINVVGGSFPARMWSAFMTQALGNRPVLDFPPPDPGQVPGPTVLVTGQPRPATAPGGGGAPGQTRTTTWCFSSCGH